MRIILLAEFIHMRPYRLQMCFQPASLFLFVFGGIVGGIGSQGYLGVDNHFPLIRVPDNNIRLHSLAAFFVGQHFTLFVFQEFLAEVMFAFYQAGSLQQSLQYHFPPIALYLGITF